MMGTDGQQLLPRLLIESSTYESSAEYSPDGSRIVFASYRTGNDEIGVCDRDGSNAVQLTFLEGPRTGTPRWSPDGTSIAFDSTPIGTEGVVYVISATGGRPRRLTPDSLGARMPYWMPDGQWLLVDSDAFDSIWKVPLDGGTPVRVTSGVGRGSRVSPDGTWIYFAKERGIWRQPVAGGEESVVLDFLGGPGYWGGYAVFDDGLYFIDNGDLTVKYKDFSSGTINTVVRLSEQGLYMHISTNRKHILMRNMASETNMDIAMLENWR